MKQYFITVNGKQAGPYIHSQLDSMWKLGQITADAIYWTDGMAGGRSILELFAPADEPGSRPPVNAESETTTRTPPPENTNEPPPVPCSAEIQIICPHCDQHVKVPSEMIGTIISCPTCTKQFHVGLRKANPPPIPQNTYDNRFPTPSPTPLKPASLPRVIIGLALGTIGLIAWKLPILGLPITILGFILSVKEVRTTQKPLAYLATTLCGIGLVLSAINAAAGAYQGAVAGWNDPDRYITNKKASQSDNKLDLDGLVVENVHYERDGTANFDVTGNIANYSNHPFRGVQVTITIEGAFISAKDADIGTVYPGQNVPFTVTMDGMYQGNVYSNLTATSAE